VVRRSRGQQKNARLIISEYCSTRVQYQDGFTVASADADASCDRYARDSDEVRVLTTKTGLRINDPRTQRMGDAYRRTPQDSPASTYSEAAHEADDKGLLEVDKGTARRATRSDSPGWGSPDRGGPASYRPSCS
jgi:hypothetical protein